MGVNLKKNFKDRAIYLPAVQKNYASCTTKDKTHFREKGKFPNKLRPQDLDLLNSNSNLFWTKGFLYSAGQHSKSYISEGMLLGNKKHKDTIVVGDSGGYQIGTGALPGIEKWKGLSAQEVKEAWLAELHPHGVMGNIVRLLDNYTDYAATVEIPLWVMTKEKAKTSPFRPFNEQDCIDVTWENLKFIRDNTGKYGAQTKWLNVLHGGQDALNGEDAWYQKVRQIKFNGWALGGGWGWWTGLPTFTKGIIKLLDEGELNHAEWLHVFGVSLVHWGPLFTAVVKGLRKAGLDDINLSFDSSSGSRTMQFGNLYGDLPALGTEVKGKGNKWTGWGWNTDKAPDKHLHAMAQNSPLFPYAYSPLYKHGITLKDLNTQADRYYANKFDTLSNHLIVNHNYYHLLKSFEIADDIVYGKDAALKAKLIPSQMLEAVDIVQEAFTTANPHTLINKHATLLEAVSKARNC